MNELNDGERRDPYTNSDLQRLNKLFYEYDEDKDGLITVRGLHEIILLSLDNFVLQHLDVLKLIEEKFNITDQNSQVNFMEFLTGYAKFLETVRQTQSKLDEQLNQLRVGSIREPIRRKRSQEKAVLTKTTANDSDSTKDTANDIIEESTPTNTTTDSQVESSPTKEHHQTEAVPTLPLHKSPDKLKKKEKIDGKLVQKWSEDAVQVLQSIRNNARDSHNESFTALVEDLLGEFQVIEEKAEEYVKKSSPSKQKLESSVNRLYNVSPSKKPMSYYLMKTSPSNKKPPTSPTKKSPSNSPQKELDSFKVAEKTYTLHGEQKLENRKKIKKRKNKEYLLNNSLQELNRLRGIVHNNREQDNNAKQKEDKTLRKSVTALKIHDQGRSLMAEAEKKV